MPAEYIFVLAIISIAVGLPVISSLILKLSKQKHERESSHASSLSEEENKILNDLHRGLERMEKRIEALETIIMEKRK